MISTDLGSFDLFKSLGKQNVSRGFSKPVNVKHRKLDKFNEPLSASSIE